MLKQVLATTRPHQWVKNSFVVAPLVFAEHLMDPGAIGRAVAAFFLFCGFSGCVYILNDLLDVEADREHPVKRNRPIASGRLSIAQARLALGAILMGATVGAFALSVPFAAIALGYFCFNIGYSAVLKHIAFVDVVSIATGFILRILGGAYAVDVPLSFWLILCTFLLSVYLALGKRKHELVAVGEGRKEQRRVLENYRLGPVRVAMIVSALATIASYTAYTLFGETVSMFSPRDLVWTLPCVIFGLFRFQSITDSSTDGRSPTDLMLRDVPFVANLVVYGIIVLVVIYVAPGTAGA